jgi:hypothetical protein
VHVLDCVSVGGSDNVGHIKYCCGVDVCDFSVVSVLVFMLMMLVLVVLVLMVVVS